MRPNWIEGLEDSTGLGSERREMREQARACVLLPNNSALLRSYQVLQAPQEMAMALPGLAAAWN